MNPRATRHIVSPQARGYSDRSNRERRESSHPAIASRRLLSSERKSSTCFANEFGSLFVRARWPSRSRISTVAWGVAAASQKRVSRSPQIRTRAVNLVFARSCSAHGGLPTSGVALRGKEDATTACPARASVSMTADHALAPDDLRASAGARSHAVPLLHLWKAAAARCLLLSMPGASAGRTAKSAAPRAKRHCAARVCGAGASVARPAVASVPRNRARSGMRPRGRTSRSVA
jgi:hypothetical protein